MGSGNEINCNNVNLHFLFDYPRGKVTLQFGDLGGNTNLEINGDFQNVSRTYLLDNATVGGVEITIDAVQSGNNWIGTMTLEGEINDFKIGGQELYLDKICGGR